MEQLQSELIHTHTEREVSMESTVQVRLRGGGRERERERKQRRKYMSDGWKGRGLFGCLMFDVWCSCLSGFDWKWNEGQLLRRSAMW